MSSNHPNKWLIHLDAPAPARDYYQALALAHQLGVFRTCHVYNKRRKPSCLHLGGPQLCATPNCINPFHWTNTRYKEGAPRTFRPPTKSDLIEVMNLYLVLNPDTPATFEGLRAVIPTDDATDAQIRIMLEPE